MRIILFIAILNVTVSHLVTGQDLKLTNFLNYPQLDTVNWNKDVQKFNANYSKVANQCQTCVYSNTDTTRTTYCFNTSTAHVRLDTSFHNITAERLTGQWSVVNAGIFEISDSLLITEGKFLRTEKIIDDQQSAQGQIVFTDKVIRINLHTTHGRQKNRKRYVIIENRYLMTKKLIGMCGPTMIGITDSGLLIMDLHSFKTILKKDGYFVFKTNINRIILKRQT